MRIATTLDARDERDLATEYVAPYRKSCGTRITRVGKRPSTPERHRKDGQWDWYFKMREDANK